ncbi:FecR family protein [Negadavirga shengliensis]|uniref:FecR family protein n=1 Tax=Negadavirga shengliensis TaxID=1389218 RepID=A0ABV9SX41_9BACT
MNRSPHVYCEKEKIKLNEEKLIRFLNNQSPPEEKKEVMKWLGKPGSEREIVEKLHDRWKSGVFQKVDNEKKIGLLERIHSKALGQEKKQKSSILLSPVWLWGRSAAAFLLVGFCLYFLYEGMFSQNKVESLAEYTEAKIIEKKTKAGEKLRLTLPDQTKVVVNSLSTISFSSDFGNANREIYLEGEAFFDIEPDKDRPFKVHTGSVLTTATGTAFNAFSRDQTVKIALTEGSVIVSHATDEVALSPGEMANYHQNNPKGLIASKFNPDDVTAWKEGRISYKNKKFSEILRILEDWYGVEFVIQGSINKNRTVSGVFNNESLEDILTGLSFTMDFEYKLDGKKVNLKSRSL